MLNIKAIYAHQLFNKDILLMKRESKDRHHFSFGEYYDEILLNGYPIEIQSHMLPIHQIIVWAIHPSSNRETAFGTNLLSGKNPNRHSRSMLN